MMILTSEIKKRLPELQALCMRAMDEAETFREAVKLTAKKCGVESSVLSAYVKAKVTDKLEAQEQKSRQMTLLLDMEYDHGAGPAETEGEETTDDEEAPADDSVYERAGVAMVVGED